MEEIIDDKKMELKHALEVNFPSTYTSYVGRTMDYDVSTDYDGEDDMVCFEAEADNGFKVFFEIEAEEVYGSLELCSIEEMINNYLDNAVELDLRSQYSRGER